MSNGDSLETDDLADFRALMPREALRSRSASRESGRATEKLRRLSDGQQQTTAHADTDTDIAWNSILTQQLICIAL